ncbi:hypothetical protein EZV62_023197 [Acer yangbiense]|uniref:Uncharacterized protein n=1 Tax=Acer yangbiense TaxID=1000413 RepID=A0A5C7H158_9ROSI|nr:hypothetical protein EZV62_023197 [Acer yangbiense]
MCDQVSDAILDACLEQDPESKVACETACCTKTNMFMVFGEITTKAKVNYEKIVHDTCREIGFVGLDADNYKVFVYIEEQSSDISQGVHGYLSKRLEEIGASDQDHMFGYAAKSVVAYGLPRHCIVHVAYAIGVPEPLSVFVDTYETGKIPNKDILVLIQDNFDFRPGMIAINLDIKRGRYHKTTTYRHFSRDDLDFTWETVKVLNVDVIK